MVLIRLGDRVRTLRKACGLTQEALAHRSGLDRTYISQIERGVCNPSLMALLNMATALDQPVAVFFREE